LYLADRTIQSLDIAARFAENLVRCRKRAGMSQEELGIGASLHRTEISQLERGLRVARIDTLVKLAGALGISPCELIEGIHWTPGRATSGQFQVAATARKPELN
jgi:transcriptional regulator with XRE-family HTH domain